MTLLYVPVGNDNTITR